MYQCRECSYRGKIRDAMGNCPACGSPNYSARRGPNAQAPVKPLSRWRLVLLVALWSYLVMHLAWKLELWNF